MVTVTADKVIVELEARLEAYNRDVRLAAARFEEAQRRTAASIKRAENEIRRSSDSIRQSLRNTASTLAAAFSVAAITRLADSYTRFTNQLRIAGLEGDDLAKVQNQLFGIAQRYGVELEGLGSLYGRVSQAGKDLGANQAQLLQLASATAAAQKIQGGTASQTAGAILQLSQALGTGVVRAEEFNSVNEGLRPILQAAADASEKYRGSVAKLRLDVINQKVASKELFDMLLAALPLLEERASKANFTIGQSLTILNNALGQYLGQSSTAQSATARFALAIRTLADNIGTVANAFAVIAVVLGSRYVASLLTAATSTGVVSTAIFAMQARAAGAATTMEALGLVSATTGRMMLAGFGGALGLAIAAISLAVLYFSTRTEEAQHNAEAFSRAGEDLAVHLQQLANYAHNASGAIAGVGQQALTSAGQMRIFAGAVGEAADRLYNLAKARRQELVESLNADATRASQEAMAARSRFYDVYTRHGSIPVTVSRTTGSVNYTRQDQEAMARERAIYQEASRRRTQAMQGARQAGALRLERYTLGSEREGGRDVEGDLARVTRDLTVARRSGMRSLVQSLEAQKFELDQYKKYRKAGLLPEAAAEQSRQDKSAFESSTAAGNSTRDAKKAGAAARSAEARARAAARRAEAAERDDAADTRAFAAAERKANNDIAAAKADLANSAVERAKIERERIEEERISRNEELEQQEREGRFGKGDEARTRRLELQRLNDERAELEKDVVDLAERERIRREGLDAALADLDNQRDLAEAEGDMALTANERRDAALRLLELAFRREKLELEGVLASEKATQAEKDIAQARLNILADLLHRQAENVERQNEGPAAAYMRGLHKTTAQINEDMERIAVSGLDALNDGLVDAIMNGESLGKVFHKVANQIIADLLRIAIQQAIIRPLMAALGGGTPGAGGGDGGFWASIAGAAGQSGGGGSSSGDLFATIAQFATTLFGRANGGQVVAGRTYMVGERGPEPFVAPMSGRIEPANRMTSPRASGGEGDTFVTVEVSAPGANAQTVELIRATMAEAAPRIVEASQRATMRTLGRRRIP